MGASAARTTTAAAAAASHNVLAALGHEDRDHTGYVLAVARVAVNRRVGFLHLADQLELFSAIFADVFINGHR